MDSNENFAVFYVTEDLSRTSILASGFNLEESSCTFPADRLEFGFDEGSTGRQEVTPIK